MCNKLKYFFNSNKYYFTDKLFQDKKMSTQTTLNTFMDGAIQTFLQNPTVECAQLIVGMANTIRKNITPPSVAVCHEDDIHRAEQVKIPTVDTKYNSLLANIYDSDCGSTSPVEPLPKSNLNVGHVVGQGTLPSGIGCSWITSEQQRYSEYAQCACVHAGKIQLVVANSPNELNEDHCAGEWCPCPGNQKKWIYRHFPIVNVTYFKQHASKVVVDVWNIVRKVSDKNGWVAYRNVRDCFSLQDYETFQSQCKAFNILRDEWKILVPSDIPENSSCFFQLKPDFR